MNIILRPPDRLAEVVSSGGKAVISAGKREESSHLIVLPNEPEVDITHVVRRTVESRATPSLTQKLRIGGLRNTDEDALSILHVPCDPSSGSAQCPEVGCQTVSPQRSVPVPIRQSGIACRPAQVIDAISAATCSTKIGKGRNQVLRFWLHWFRLLRIHRCHRRPAAYSDQNNEKSLGNSFRCELCCHVCLLC